MSSFRDLRAWKQAMDLTTQIYRTTETFPPQERFGLTAQMRNAAASIPSNIAEGQGRMTPGEWLQFLGHARGSLFELSTQIELAVHSVRFDADQTSDMRAFKEHGDGAALTAPPRREEI